jgi:HK97 family phage major capsid protein
MDETKAKQPTDSDYILPDDKAFPVMAPKDVKDAVASWGRYKGKASFTSFKRRLIALCKRKGEAFTAALPESWKPAAKAVNIGENVETVRKAFYQTFSPPVAYDGPMPSVWWSLDESDIWDEYVIGCKRDKDSETYWRISYTVEGDTVTFAPSPDWQQVEEVWQEVTDVPEAATMSVDESVLLSFGSPIKALDNGHLGGYLVIFSDEKSPDLTGDYFTKSTDFGFTDSTPAHVWLHHRQPLKTRGGGTIQVKERIGTATLTKDDKGVLIDALLFNRELYEAALVKMGWSSGTAAHLVEREQKGAAWHVTQWPLGPDASLTPTPAEPRLHVVDMKSYSPDELDVKAVLPQADAEASAAAATEADKTATNPAPERGAEQKTVAEVTQMDDKQVQELVASSIAAAAPQIAEAAAKAVLEKIPAAGAGVSITNVKDLAAERPFKSMGEFFSSVVEAAKTPDDIDKRLRALKAPSGLNEAVSSEGGFLVRPEYANVLLEKLYNTGEITRRVYHMPVGANSNGVSIPAVAESSRANGSRFGGVQAYWAGEAAQFTGSKPSFEMIDLKLKKLTALCYASDELLADAVALESFITRKFPEEMAFKTEDAIFEGSGAGMPLGITNAPALVTVTKEVGQAAATIVKANIDKMYARMWGRSLQNAVWYVNQDAMPQLLSLNQAVGAGGSVVFLAAGSMANQPYNTLYGRPIVPVEYCSTLGTVGDIIFADLGEYVMQDKGAAQMASSIHVRFDYDETAFRFVYRVDGQPMWRTALTPFKGTNTLSPFVALATRA